MYGEGEYIHPIDADNWNKMSCGMNHWRNWIPATYYCTHSLAPIMYITETKQGIAYSKRNWKNVGFIEKQINTL